MNNNGPVNEAEKTGNADGKVYDGDMVVIESSPDTSPDSEILVEDDLVQCTSISNSYCGEWEKMFLRPNYMQSLKSFALQGKLRSSRFRSISWKLFLGVLPEEQSQWIPKTKEWRDRYTTLKDRLVINPHKTPAKKDLVINNPLSQDTESPWNQFFQDKQLDIAS